MREAQGRGSPGGGAACLYRWVGRVFRDPVGKTYSSHAAGAWGRSNFLGSRYAPGCGAEPKGWAEGGVAFVSEDTGWSF